MKDITPEEKQFLEEKRKRDEAVKVCIDEVNAVLEKHNMKINVQHNITIVPK